jgi:hypothetical protein
MPFDGTVYVNDTWKFCYWDFFWGNICWWPQEKTTMWYFRSRSFSVWSIFQSYTVPTTVNFNCCIGKTRPRFFLISLNMQHMSLFTNDWRTRTRNWIFHVITCVCVCGCVAGDQMFTCFSVAAWSHNNHLLCEFRYLSSAFIVLEVIDVVDWCFATLFTVAA